MAIKTPGQFIPGTTSGVVVDSKYIKGGYITVNTIEDRDNLLTSTDVITIGSKVYVIETGKEYVFTKNNLTEEVFWEDTSSVSVDLQNQINTVSSNLDNTNNDLDLTKVRVTNVENTIPTLATKEQLTQVKETAEAAVVSNPAIEASTHTKITYDEKGLVTGGEELSVTDIPTLPESKIDGLSSKLQGYANRISSNESNISHLQEVTNNIDSRVVTIESAYIKSVSYAPSTGIFEFTKQDGTKSTYDLAIEKVVTNFVYNSEKEALVLTLADGSTQEVPLSSFIEEYTAQQNATQVQLSISTGKEISAELVDEGISYNKLNSEAKNKLALSADLTAHTTNKSNPHNVTKAQVGLGNVTNDSQVKRSEMGVVNGVATLDETGKVVSSQLNITNIENGTADVLIQTTDSEQSFKVMADGRTKVRSAPVEDDDVVRKKELTEKSFAYYSIEAETARDYSKGSKIDKMFKDILKKIETIENKLV